MKPSLHAKEKVMQAKKHVHSARKHVTHAKSKAQFQAKKQVQHVRIKAKKQVTKIKHKRNVPTVLTLFNLVLGVSSILFTFYEAYYWAAFAILAAMIFDTLDGMAARTLGVVSPMGVELDSLADMVSFVLAPALLVFFSFFESLHFAIIITLFIVVCGVLRLARFNSKGPQDYFEGMPTPVFAGIVIVLTISQVQFTEEIAAIFFFIFASMMIGHMHYPKFKAPGEQKYRYLGVAFMLTLITALLVPISSLAFVIIEYVSLWGLLIIPMCFDKVFLSKKPLYIFAGGLLLLTVAFYNNLTYLMVLPVLYTIVAMPLIQRALSPKVKLF